MSDGAQNKSNNFPYALGCVGILVLLFLVIMAAVSIGGRLIGLGSSKGGSGDSYAYNSGGSQEECWNLTDSSSMTVDQIRNYLEKRRSPWSNTAQSVLDAGKEFQINPILILAISGQESTFGTAHGGNNRSVKNNNPGNVKRIGSDTLHKKNIHVIGYDDQNHSKFASMNDGWRAEALMLWRRVHERGLKTLYDINVGSDGKGVYAEDTNWHKGVRRIMASIAPCSAAPGNVDLAMAKGDFCPPLGGKQKNANSKKHGDGVAGIFGSTKGFNRKSGNAIDWGRACNCGYEGVTVFSTFNGRVTQVKKDHVSGTGGNKRSGDLVWIVSDDGKHEAMYAHIVANVSQGTKVSKCQSLGQVAGRPKTQIDPHLHFQFWFNGRGLSSNEIYNFFKP